MSKKKKKGNQKNDNTTKINLVIAILGLINVILLIVNSAITLIIKLLEK